MRKLQLIFCLLLFHYITRAGFGGMGTYYHSFIIDEKLSCFVGNNMQVGSSASCNQMQIPL